MSPHSMKSFVLGLRIVELETPYIIIGEDIQPKLCEYMTRLQSAQFVDNYYHTYCGQIKEVLDNFLTYWMNVMDRTLKEADLLENCTPLSELKDYLQDVIKTHLDKQVDFAKIFLPVESSEEQKAFEDLQEKFGPFMNFLYKLEKELHNFDKRDSLQDFFIGHIEQSLKKKKALFQFAHSFIAKYLATKLYELRVCMEEIQLRLQGNLKAMQEERESTLYSLRHELYEGTKNKLIVFRNDHTNLKDPAEIDLTIKKIRHKIKQLETELPVKHLHDELAYWEHRLSDFDKIEKTLKKLQDEDDSLKKYENHFTTSRFDHYSEHMKECCQHNMVEQITARRKFIDEKTLETSRALITFFTVRGYNRVTYNDSVGKYNVDDYGHKVYLFDHGSFKAHTNCSGQYKQVNENEQKYMFDESGRHIIEKGEKLYQCAPCTSSYKLRDGNLLVKQTKDCGHSEIGNPGCKMNLNHAHDIEMLPLIEPVDIKGKFRKRDYITGYDNNVEGCIVVGCIDCV